MLGATRAMAVGFTLQGTFTAPGLTSPQYAEVDAAHRLHVMEFSAASDVAVFDQDHQFVGRYGGGMLGWAGNLAIGANGHTYVLESSFVRDLDSSLQSVKTFASHGPGAGITCDTGSNIYVADGMANTVTKYAPDGTILMTLAPTGAQSLLHPNSVVVDEGGMIYVADSFHDRVEIFNATGDFVKGFSTVVWEASHIRDLARSADGTIYAMQDGGLTAYSSDGVLLASYANTNYNGLALDGNTLYAINTSGKKIDYFAVPEPGTAMMIGGGMLLAVGRKRRGIYR